MCLTHNETEDSVDGGGKKTAAAVALGLRCSEALLAMTYLRYPRSSMTGDEALSLGTPQPVPVPEGMSPARVDPRLTQRTGRWEQTHLL